jgi:SAM-dependent methyltransferase
MDFRNLSRPSTAVPSDVRPKYEAITALTDAFCKRHLNEEYAEMCRRLTVALAQKQPTPLVRGRAEVWACGIVRTIGWANVLDDPKQSPYMKLIAIDPEFGVAESTGQAKSMAIRRMFGIGRLNVHWTLPSRLGVNPLVWRVEVNGVLVDIRQESRGRQKAAFQKGLIPYIPADLEQPVDDQPQKPQDTPIHALEGGLFGAIFGFHKKVMALLRAANLPDDKLGVASERIGHLLREMTEGIKSTKDLNIQPRLDAMYEDMQRMVDELAALGSLRDQMEQIYSETLPADIPWNIETPPKALVELIDSGQIQPCKAIDLGCGAGNYAIYLASLGFDVTGVDISPSAIALAEANAKQKGVACRFVAADVVGGLPEVTETFDFAYDWSLLHHVFPLDRKRYAETVHRLLVPGGKYLSVCFSEKDAGFGGTGPIRRTPLGTMLYFSSEDELRDIFAPDFDIRTLTTVQVEGKREPHLMNFAFMEKKLASPKKRRGRRRT